VSARSCIRSKWKDHVAVREASIRPCPGSSISYSTALPQEYMNARIRLWSGQINCRLGSRSGCGETPDAGARSSSGNVTLMAQGLLALRLRAFQSPLCPAAGTTRNQSPEYLKHMIPKRSLQSLRGEYPCQFKHATHTYTSPLPSTPSSPLNSPPLRKADSSSSLPSLRNLNQRLNRRCAGW